MSFLVEIKNLKIRNLRIMGLIPYILNSKKKKNLLKRFYIILLETKEEEIENNKIISKNYFKFSVVKKKRPQNNKYVYLIPKFRFIDFLGIENYPKIFLIRSEIKNSKNNLEQGNLKIGFDGIFLRGPQKSGKTFLGHVIAGELGFPIFHRNWLFLKKLLISKNLKKNLIFFKNFHNIPDSFLFIDDFQIVSNEFDKNLVENDEKLLQRLIGIIKFLKKKKKINIFLMGASRDTHIKNHFTPNNNFFENEIILKEPNSLERRVILSSISKNLDLKVFLFLEELIEKTNGFSVGYLFELFFSAINFALLRIEARKLKGEYFKKKKKIQKKFTIAKSDFLKSLKKLRKKLNAASVKISSPINWNNIGGLDEIRRIMSHYIIEPIKKSQKERSFAEKGFGFLLYGPPGCGKTLIAQAIARESGSNFIGVKGPEIFDKFLGESEKSIRSIFSKARSQAPTIIFFDEIDSIAASRSENENISQSGTSNRVLNQLLTELDGFEENKAVYIIAATNRPDIIDRAILRPGRIDKSIFVPLPNLIERNRILRTIAKSFPVLPYLSFQNFSKKLCFGFSGADLTGAVREGFLDLQKKKISYYISKSNPNGIRTSKILLLGSKNLAKGCVNITKKK